MKILVTGTAGFIGFHLANRLLARGDEVVGLDSINDYYDVNLKYGRLSEAGIDREKIEYNKLVKSQKYPNYKFIKLNLEDRENLFKLFEKEKFDKVCHLAAQAGVRYSLTNPYAYIDSNIVGHINILEAVRHNGVKALSYASSSSVYGLNKKQPFSTDDNVDHPISLYAATKKADELMSHTYSYLYNIGNGSPVKLMDFIEAIEEILGKEAKKNLLPMQPGDVPSTYADTTNLEKDLGYKPYTPVKEGIAKFIEWYRGFYKV